MLQAGRGLPIVGVAKLANLKKLRYLDLSGSVVTAGGLKTLASLPSLQRLSLWNVKSVNDTAASALASLKTVSSLDLSNTGVTDETLLALAKQPNLQRVYVNDTAISADAVDTFKKLRPSTMVYREMRAEPREPLVGSTKARGAYTE